MRSAEWRIAGSFLLILAALILVAKVQAVRASNTLDKRSKSSSRLLPSTISVTISGAVSKPGIYEVKTGTTLRKLLNRAKPKSWANLRNLDLDAVVNSPHSLEIEELSEIVVFLRMADGALKKINLPAKSRLCDMKSINELKLTLDPAIFKSRRQLKDGEILDAFPK